MRQKPENVFRASVHRHLPKTLHHEKMSNDYTSGTADDWYSGQKDIWIEYKWLPRTPQRATIWLVNPNVKEPMLSVRQQEWLNNRWLEGRSVFVIVGCPDGGVILHDQEWMKPFSADEFRERLISRKDLAQWIVQQTSR